MDTNRLALIFVICVNILLGAFVYLRDRKNAVNVSFGILTLTIAAWTFGVFEIVSIWRDSNPIHWVRITYALGTFMAAGFAIFSIIFPNGHISTAKKYIYYMAPISIALAAISLSPLSVREIIYDNGVIIKTHYGIGNILWSLYVIGCMALAFHSLACKWKRGNGIEKLRIQYLFLGIAITTTFIAITNVLIPLVFGYESPSGYGPCFTMIMVYCIAYAIIKHRLMDIRMFIKKGIAYSILLAGTALGIGSIVIGVSHAFPDLSKSQSSVIFLLAGSFIVFAIRPLSHNLRELVSAFIYRDRCGSQRALSNFSQLAARILDLEELLGLIFNAAVESMKVDKASMWLLDPETKSYHNTLLLGLKSEELPLELSAGEGVVYYLETASEPIIKEELERGLSLEAYDRIESDFRKLKAELIFPLLAEDQLMGIVALGGKSSGRIYYEEDVEILKAIIDQSAIATKNARLHQQVVSIKNYNQAILENLTSGVIAVAPFSSGVFTINQAGIRILGLSDDDAANADIKCLPEYIRDLLTKTMENGLGFSDLETTITSGYGKKKTNILISATLLRDEKQQIVGPVAVFSDVTAMKAIEAEIRQTENLASLGRMAAELAHEIKNPLVTIKTFFELFAENQFREEVDKDFIELAINETERINSLVRQLLDLTRPKPAEIEWCSIDYILDAVLSMLRSNTTNKDIEILDLRNVEMPMIYADSDQLKQVFLNIGLNGLEAMDDEGRLSVSASMERTSAEVLQNLEQAVQNSPEDLHVDSKMNSIIVEISDTGKGISTDELETIFEPFYTTKVRGTGLGLAIVRGIIREHKGAISVNSQEGIGTTFRIEIPLIKENQTEIDSEQLSIEGQRVSEVGVESH